MISRRTPAHSSNSSISLSETGEKRYRTPLSSSNGTAQDKRITGYKIKVKAIDNGDRSMLPGGWGIVGESPTGDQPTSAGRSRLYRKSMGGFALACSRFVYDIRYTLS
jgi:hypothetical protein